MEITKMLTISTAHISKYVADWLNKHMEDSIIVVYPKGLYGWYIWTHDVDDNIPFELRNVINFALKNDCEWLCLDRDGEIINELSVYEW